MSTPRIVQRSPDLGLGIRLQRLQEAKPVPQVQQKPPFWWGWADASGKPSAALEVLWMNGQSPAYFPGLWVAVVEGATSVTWQIELRSVEWLIGDDGEEIEVVSPDTPWSLRLPPSGKLPAPDVLFSALPLFVAAGNSLSVMTGQVLGELGPYGTSGKLVAQAFVNGVSVGAVKLVLKRIKDPIEN